MCACVCVCVCWVRRERGSGGDKGACPLRVYVTLFYAFIHFSYGLCPVYPFYKCDKFDVPFYIYFKFSLK